jgi:GTP pyrophosphokinase
MDSYKDFLIELSLQQAAAFAADLHKDQKRKGSGERYFVHPEAVYRMLVKLGIKDKNILVAAFLHDTVEDTPATYNEIKNKFNKEVADLVKELTSQDKEIAKIGKPDYLLKKLINMSDNALVVKLADRLHNVQDIDSMSQDKANKQAVQTDYILQGLKSKRNIKGPHKKIIRQIEKQIKKYL